MMMMMMMRMKTAIVDNEYADYDNSNQSNVASTDNLEGHDADNDEYDADDYDVDDCDVDADNDHI